MKYSGQESDLTHNLFSYGTLQVPRILQTVISKALNGVPADLPGYAVYRVKDAEYPGIVASPDAVTHGTLYTGVLGEDLEILDRFEGALYERTELEVIPEPGKAIKTWVYVIKDIHRNLLAREPWNLDDFMENDMDRFMKRFVDGRRQAYMNETDG